MADAVATQTIVDGKRHVVQKFTNVSDGTGESEVVKVDVSALNGAPSEVKIMRVHYSTFGMGVRVLFDASTDIVALLIPADSDGVFDFTSFGGIPNNSGSGKTGDIMFTTVGHSSGDTYTIVMECEK